MRSRILLFGNDMRIFLSLARAFGRRQHIVHVVTDTHQAPALKSRYVHQIHRVQPYYLAPDAWRKEIALILSEHDFDLIVPCIDPDLIAMNENRELFSGCNLAIPSRENWGVFFDKDITHITCSELGINACRYSSINKFDTADVLLEKYDLPFVIKPQRSYWEDRLSVKEKVYIVENQQELKDCLAEIDKDGRFLIEDYFQGSGVGVSVLAKNGVILQAFQHRRLREGRGGSSSYRISEPVHAELLNACEKLMQATRHTGVCMFEFRFNYETSEWVLLETNARFWGSMPLPTALGVDFPNELLAIHTGQPVSDPFQYRDGVRSRNYILDGFNLAKTELNTETTWQWSKDMLDYLCHFPRLALGMEKNDSFVSDDLAPGFWELVYLPAGIMRKLAAAIRARLVGNSDHSYSRG